MGNDCCVREDRTRADVVDLKQLYVQPTMKMPVSKDSKIDNKGSFCSSPVKFRGFAQELQEPDEAINEMMNLD